jgi:type IV pilus assembly protein PilN
VPCWFVGRLVPRWPNREAGRAQRYLETEIAVLDQKIAEIRDLQKTRDELLARMRVIQELQGNRPVIVRVFDELVRTLAKGVHFRKLQMQGTQLLGRGRRRVEQPDLDADAQSRRSDWFASPNLKSIKEDPQNPNYGAQASTFNLTFVQANPNKADQGE